MTKQIIGLVTTYEGQEFSWMRGMTVKVIGVYPDAASEGHDPDEGPARIDDEEVLARRGLRALDRIEVQPWVKEAGRFSFVSSDPKACDLKAFAHLVPE